MRQQEKSPQRRFFSERLRAIRGQRTKAAFARELGCSPQNYQRYEAGRIPDPVILADIAQRSGVTVDWLLGAGPETGAGPPGLVREARATYATVSELAQGLEAMHDECSKIDGRLSTIEQLLLRLLAEEEGGHSEESERHGGGRKAG